MINLKHMSLYGRVGSIINVYQLTKFVAYTHDFLFNLKPDDAVTTFQSFDFGSF